MQLNCHLYRAHWYLFIFKNSIYSHVIQLYIQGRVHETYVLKRDYNVNNILKTKVIFLSDNFWRGSRSM